MNEFETTRPTAEAPIGRPGAKRTFTVVLVLLAVALAALVFRGIRTRVRAEVALARETERSAVLEVGTILPKAGAQAEELTLPGNIQAFTDTPVYSRTDGYLKRWYTDIGARVKTNQLLAEIETPEVDQELRQARAETETAQANLQLSSSTATRWESLLKTDSVSHQETDEKIGDLAAKKAAVDAAVANVKRLEEMQLWERIYAPFDGIITARNVDTGSLITAGSSSGGKELFHIAAIGKMRVYVQVPQAYSRVARPGTATDLALAELPGRHFRGRIARTSNAIDPVSRTLTVEVDVDNPDGTLLPGAYVEVHMKLPGAAGALKVPVNALMFRSEGIGVAAVRNGHIVLLPITIGHDYGDDVEITSGVSATDRLIVNPPDSIVAGEAVQIVSR
ncbi:MAG: efflux RND transporter periplasmic adaptor subunit [Bryobacteraceae bacterium]